MPAIGIRTTCSQRATDARIDARDLVAEHQDNRCVGGAAGIVHEFEQVARARATFERPHSLAGLAQSIDRERRIGMVTPRDAALGPERRLGQLRVRGRGREAAQVQVIDRGTVGRTKDRADIAEAAHVVEQRLDARTDRHANVVDLVRIVGLVDERSRRLAQRTARAQLTAGRDGKPQTTARRAALSLLMAHGRNVLQHAAVAIHRAPLVALLSLLLAAPACGGSRDADVSESTPALARRLVRDEGGLLLDVRSVEEFESGHVEGAKLVPHDEVGARVDEIASLLDGDRSKPVVVYCRSGRRSKLAKQTLEQAGFTQVLDLGSMSSWCEDC